MRIYVANNVLSLSIIYVYYVSTRFRMQMHYFLNKYEERDDKISNDMYLDFMKKIV